MYATPKKKKTEYQTSYTASSNDIIIEVLLSTSFGTSTKDLEDNPPTIRISGVGSRPPSDSDMSARVLVLAMEQLQPGRHGTKTSCSCSGMSSKKAGSGEANQQGHMKPKRTDIGKGEGEESMSRHQTSRSKRHTVSIAVAMRHSV